MGSRRDERESRRPRAICRRTLRAGRWKVTAAVRKGVEIVALYPGFVDCAYGVAIDLGSTTIAVYLCDLATGEVVASAGAMNPQIRFGEDVMSRVSYAMANPGGVAELTRAARGAVDQLIGETAREARIARDQILEATIVGNPIMHHLFLGLDPTELGVAPFALTIDSGYETHATACGLAIAPGAYVYALPCIAGYVGADAAGVALAETPYLSDELTLIADVGTNAEILFGDRRGLLACSSPTGPAFEGAQISCGQRAAAGSDRTCPHRSPDARAALQGDRLRSLVGRARFSGGDQDDRRHRGMRFGHHRGDRRDVSSGILSHEGVNGGCARRQDAPHRARRPHIRLRAQAKASPGSRSIRATYAQSSSPRRRYMRAPSC